MTPTVDDLRNEIRLAVGRFERVESTAFTKETLAAVCEAVDCEVETTDIPPKPEMRAGILRETGALDGADPDRAHPDEADRPFRKGELESIAAALRDE